MDGASAHEAIRQVVVDYLEGMIWGDEQRLRQAFHSGALQVGHFDGTYEFFPLQEFIDWVKAEPSEPPGQSLPGRTAVDRGDRHGGDCEDHDSCFDTDFTDYLVMVNDRADATGRWQIVTKACHVHAGRRRGEAPAR